MRALAPLALLVAASCDPTAAPVCDGTALASRLASAAAGSTVEVGACRIEGSFTVPAGVVLSGTEDSVIAASGGPALTLVGTGDAASVRDLTIESDGPAAIVVRAERATISSVTIALTDGVGIGAEGSASLTLSDVRVEGPIDAASAGPASVGDTPARYGVALVNVRGARLEDVSLSGLGDYALFLLSTEATLERVRVSSTLGAAVLLSGGSATLRDTQITGVFQGFRLMPAYGLVVIGGARVETERLVVREVEGVGVFQDGSSGHHVDLTSSDNRGAGAWLQRTSGVAIEGASGELAGNGLAGVVALGGEGFSLRGARIEGTRLVTRVYAEAGSVMVGDGAQLVGTVGSEISDVTLAGNARIGLLLDLRDGGDLPALSAITVDASGTALGAQAQGAALADGWDREVTRLGAAAANDAAFAAELDIVAIVGPSDIPSSEAAAAGGLDAIVGPSD